MLQNKKAFEDHWDAKNAVNTGNIEEVLEDKMRMRLFKLMMLRMLRNIALRQLGLTVDGNFQQPMRRIAFEVIS